MTTSFLPVSSDERLRTLDVLRGAALLGIVLMNIPFSGLPMAAYANPNVWGGNDPLNVGVLAVQWVLFDGKMRALFSIMFGAGIVLFMQRALERDNSVRAADLLSRRMLWLILFGTLHGWLIWAGDILYAYGLFGLLIFPMRNVAPRKLLITAGVALLLLSLAIVGLGFSQRSTRNDSMAARAVEAQGRPLTKEQQDAKKEWDEAYNQALPSKQKLQEEIDNYRKGYGGVMTERARIMRQFNFVPVYFPGDVDIWALMLIGMALFKLGILQGERSTGFYARMAADRVCRRDCGELAVHLRNDRVQLRHRRLQFLEHAVSNWPRVGGARACLGADPARQGRPDAMADRSAGRRGADGVLELHLPFDHLCAGLLRPRPQDVRATAALSALLRRPRHLDPQPGVESDLAALLPLRTARVVLALADLLAAAADAAARAGDSSRRLRGGVIW